ncbi:hypothetical protein SLEP1_g7370 [Rubroshorea leprosula]|uniref:Uncharacterized protein n=1 Tax=Rubroshorea leprosula TaxID=152421 RepID=A0AAV5I936_9ROSI|nr:hypothetical protein SLEP1_g7370 [Rubroshorea leprosula]
MRAVLGSPFPTSFNVTEAGAEEFPALIGQSVSLAVLQYPAGTTNPLPTPILALRSFFSSSMGLVHFQYDADTGKLAVAISAFGSANAGFVSIPVTLFGMGIDDDILAKSFKIDVATVESLKAALTPPRN